MPKINWKNEIGNPVYPSCKTIRDWCRMFGVKPRSRCGWFQVPKTNRWLWFPSSKTENWSNLYSNPTIVEEYTGNEQEKEDGALLARKNLEKVEEEIRKEENGEVGCRIVFFRNNRKIGAIAPLKHGFGFLGVFRIDAEESRNAGKCVYRRVEDSVEFPG